MWNFGWNPQPMGLQGQFCGGDMMNQQSQAQSQAQTQAQLAHLREQNSILNQQLASQAQSHIQNLQQLIPFHQPTPHPHSTSTPPTPQPTPQASEPPTPVAPPSTRTGSSVSFNPGEMMQQMKNTVESSIQRSMNQLPSPSLTPIPVPPQTSSHLHPPDDAPTSHQRSHRRSRSQRLDPDDLTNVRSPSLAVLVVTDLQDEPVVRLDHDPRPEEDSPRREDQEGLRRSLFGQPPHDIEKYDTEIKMTTHHRNQLTRQPLFNLQRGNTTHNSHTTAPTLNQTTTTTTNTPPTSAIQRTMERLSKILIYIQCSRLDRLHKTTCQSSHSIRLLHQTTHGILPRLQHNIPSTKPTITPVRFSPIP